MSADPAIALVKIRPIWIFDMPSWSRYTPRTTARYPYAKVRRTRVARSFLPSAESQSSTEALADGREWARGGRGLLVEIPGKPAVFGLTGVAGREPVLAGGEVDDARCDRLVLVRPLGRRVAVLADRVRVPEMVPERHAD